MGVRAVSGAVGMVSETVVAAPPRARLNTPKSDVVLLIFAARPPRVAVVAPFVVARPTVDSGVAPPPPRAQTLALGAPVRLRPRPRAAPLTPRPQRAERANAYVARRSLRPPPPRPVPPLPRSRCVPPRLRL